MDDIQTLLITYGALLVFINVLIEQAGLPIPAYPIVVVSGTLAAQGQMSWLAVILSVACACLIADSAWYLAGQRFGGGLLRTVCRVSLTPDSCIRQTQARYVRVGPRLLLIAKFLPGAGALSTVMAGLTRTSFPRFLAYDLAGSLVWGGSALILGMVFNKMVGTLLDVLSEYGRVGMVFIVLALALYMAFQWLQRRRLLKRLGGVPRTTVEELTQWNESGKTTVLIDVRPEAVDRIPGAIVFDLRSPLHTLDVGEPSANIVVYCACPNEVSAAILVERLRAAGFENTWALQGGYDALMASTQSRTVIANPCDVPAA